MKLDGMNLIAGQSVGGGSTFRAVNPMEPSARIEPPIHEAGPSEVDQAMKAAAEAFDAFSRTPSAARAGFLRTIAAAVEADDELLARANLETALPLGRLQGERTRTANQLRMFAALIEEGSWVGARVDHGDPQRKPAPKPDLRRMLIPIGPVVVFAASNFPLAFSVAGGDTASALAAGCPVVVKAHPAHPGTSEWTARLILKAAEDTGMPAGVFSLLQGRSHELGQALVTHPQTKAVGFTGSLRAGRALFDLAARRDIPISVYAEMGSTNPIFILPDAMKERAAKIAEGLVQSVTMGVGQFCTNPGLVLAINDAATNAFTEALAARMRAASPGTMLYGGLCKSFSDGIGRFAAIPGVQVAATADKTVDPGRSEAAPTVFTADAGVYLGRPALREELFGPATLLVTGTSEALRQIARTLDGHLTATLHATDRDMEMHRDLIGILEKKVGRLLFNGFPTGVEVGHAMQHGGPYPATTDSRTTSVGSAAIDRFVRPICYQDFPDALLPEPLRAANPQKIWRMVDGKMSRD